MTDAAALRADGHRYPAGHIAGDDPGDWLWEFPSYEMGAWRYCPPCGAALLPAEYTMEQPRCSGCRRAYSVCPCACVDGVSGSNATMAVGLGVRG